jgi:type IV secretion system protein VirB1
MLDFVLLAHQCAPEIHPNTLAHVVQVESGYNPFAIGVVGAHLERQPRTRDEAIATAAWLEANHFNYSVGLGQVNKNNFVKYSLSIEEAFDPCLNLQAAAAILKECYERALQNQPDEQIALRDSFSCYYSGNFTTGYRAGYVLKVVAGTSAARQKKVAPGSSEIASDKSTPPPTALLF